MFKIGATGSLSRSPNQSSRGGRRGAADEGNWDGSDPPGHWPHYSRSFATFPRTASGFAVYNPIPTQRSVQDP